MPRRTRKGRRPPAAPPEDRGLAVLTPWQLDVVRQALRAAAEGPFFPDWEFPILFGLSRDEVRAVLADFPHVDDAVSPARTAINNALLHLVSYPHRCEDRWHEWLVASPADLVAVFERWKDIAPYCGPTPPACSSGSS